MESEKKIKQLEQQLEELKLEQLALRSYQNDLLKEISRLKRDVHNADWLYLEDEYIDYKALSEMIDLRVLAQLVNNEKIEYTPIPARFYDEIIKDNSDFERFSEFKKRLTVLEEYNKHHTSSIDNLRSRLNRIGGGTAEPEMDLPF